MQPIHAPPPVHLLYAAPAHDLGAAAPAALEDGPKRGTKAALSQKVRDLRNETCQLKAELAVARAQLGDMGRLERSAALDQSMIHELDERPSESRSREDGYAHDAARLAKQLDGAQRDRQVLEERKKRLEDQVQRMEREIHGLRCENETLEKELQAVKVRVDGMYCAKERAQRHVKAVLDDAPGAAKHAGIVAQNLHHKLEIETKRRKKVEKTFKDTRRKISCREHCLVDESRHATGVEKESVEIARNFLVAVAKKNLLPESHGSPTALAYEVFRRTMCQLAGKPIPRNIPKCIVDWSLLVYGQASAHLVETINKKFMLMSPRHCREKKAKTSAGFDWGKQADRIVEMVTYCKERKLAVMQPVDEMCIADQFCEIASNGIIYGAVS